MRKRRKCEMVSDLKEKMIEHVFKKNIFVLLQIIWIIEFYVFGILAIESATKNIFDFGQKYEIIENICCSIVDKINQYQEYILYLAVVIFIVGLIGTFFNFLPIFSNYRAIIMYCDAGISVGGWLFLIYITYKIYSMCKLMVLFAPLIVYGITYIVKEKREN